MYVPTVLRTVEGMWARHKVAYCKFMSLSF